MCEICDSGLIAEINKKINWRPDRVVKWAGRRGLAITEKQLSAHFRHHLETNKKNAVERSINKSRLKISGIAKNDIAAGSAENSAGIDNSFLSEVVKRVYENLIQNEFDLKLEHGFKAIEIKQKIADGNDVEKLLLELLDEIRHQELATSNANSR